MSTTIQALILLLSATLVLAFVPPAAATFVVYTDQPSFVAASGASLDVSYPAAKAINGVPYTENGFTMVQANGHGNGVDDFTPLLPDGGSGNEFAVSGPEHVDITLPGDRWAFGMWLQDGFDVGFNTNTATCPQSDSTFRLRLLDGNTVIYEITFDPPKDEAYFLGILSDSATFDNVEFREVGAAIDENAGPHCENDFIGYLYTADMPPPPIPELGTFALVSVGLLGVGWVGFATRRRG